MGGRTQVGLRFLVPKAASPSATTPLIQPHSVMPMGFTLPYHSTSFWNAILKPTWPKSKRLFRLLAVTALQSEPEKERHHWPDHAQSDQSGLCRNRRKLGECVFN